MPIDHGFKSSPSVCWEVSQMIKSDLLTGLLVGIVLGLVFTPQLAPHLAVIAILAVVFGAKMIGLK